MTPLNFAIVGLRLLAIYFFVDAVSVFSQAELIGAFSIQITGSSQPTVYFIACIPSCILLLAAGLLFIFAEPVAKRLVPPVADESQKTVCSVAELQAVIFAAVGILILADALPKVGNSVLNLFYLFREYQMGSGDDKYQHSSYLMPSVGVIAQLVIGLFLFLNPRGIGKIWRWLRTAGTPPVQ